MKKIIILFTSIMLFAVTGCIKHSEIELDENALLYSDASSSIPIISDTPTDFYIACYFKGLIAYPFVQKVISEKGDRIQLPIGWVDKKNTHDVSNEELTADMLSKRYKGNFINPKLLRGKQVNWGYDNPEFEMQIVRADNNEEDALVFFDFADWHMVFISTIRGNLLCCHHAILYDHGSYESETENVTFTLVRADNKNGVLYKMFDMNYGKHMSKTRFLEDGYEVHDFDPSKLTKEDCKQIKDGIEKDGFSTSLAMSANTFKALCVAQ